LAARAMLFRRYVRAGLAGAGGGGAAYDAVFLPEWGGLAALLPKGAPLVTNLATGIRLGEWIAGRQARDFPLALRPGRVLQDVLETRQIRRSRGLVPISRAVLAWNEQHVAPLPPATVVRNCVDLPRVARDAAEAPLPDGWPGDAGAGGADRGGGRSAVRRSAGGEGDAGAAGGDRGGGRAGGGGGAPVVLFVGRLERRKGVLPAVEAFGAVLQRHPEARLVLAGASGDARFEPTRRELLQRLPGRARERVTFLGHVPGDRLAAAMAQATVVLCPSRWEGFGNVALEAMGAGAPLIVTTGSGYDDFCRDGVNALMVAPDDPAALARSVHRVLAEPGLAAHLKAGAAARLDRFDPDVVAINLAAAVRDLLAADAATAEPSSAPRAPVAPPEPADPREPADLREPVAPPESADPRPPGAPPEPADPPNPRRAAVPQAPISTSTRGSSSSSSPAR
ncbi:hypothetical protein C5B96_13275, partial [Subtercola sp. Z020]|uniref:glycosyltransferase family 4 protein n=1 Tax=Subtercola sp. Z020 TaxID=2080582 RepID=UPI000D4CA2F8